MPTSSLKYHTVGADFHYRFTDPANADASAFFDDVVDHLQNKLDAEDVFLAVDHNSQTFRLSLLVGTPPEDKVEQIIKLAMDAMRTAFHACGASTPDWPGPGHAIAEVVWEGDLSTEPALASA